jgi:hypothetical protein
VPTKSCGHVSAAGSNHLKNLWSGSKVALRVNHLESLRQEQAAALCPCLIGPITAKDDTDEQRLVMGKRTRIGIGILAAAAIGGSVVAYAVTGPPGQVALSSSAAVVAGSPATLGNQPTAPSPNNRVAANDKVRWLESFQNNGLTVAEGTITQTWDPSKQELQSGSVEVPSGWTPSYTVDGTTWVAGEPADPTTVRGVRADAPFVPALGKPGVVAPIQPPSVSSVSTSITGAGDSYHAIFEGDRIFALAHHLDPLSLACFNKISGAPCGTLRPSRALNSPGYGDAWVDQRTGRAYLPAIEHVGLADHVVVSCLDLRNGTDCGIVDVDPNGAMARADYPFMSQPWAYNGEFMFLYARTTGELMVACAEVSRMRPCGGQPYASDVGFSVDLNYASARHLEAYWAANGETPYLNNGRVMYSATPAGTLDQRLACFDARRHQGCSAMATGGWADGNDLVPRLDATGDLIGFCDRAHGTDPVTCFDLNARPIASSAALEAWMPSGNLSWPGHTGGSGVYATVADSRTLLPYDAPSPNVVLCFDWATDATCANFPMALSSGMKTYSLREDPYAPNCIWAVGDDGFLESFEAVTGTNGCHATALSVAPSYCDNARGHTRGWDMIKFNDFAGGHNGLAVTLRDQTGQIVPGWLAKRFSASTTSIDLSAVPMAAVSPALMVEIEYVGLNAAAFAGGTPTAEVTWRGDPMQLCTTTIPTSNCPTLFVPLLPGVVGLRSEATTTVGALVDSVAIDLAYDLLVDRACAQAGLSVSVSLNGGSYPAAPGLQIRGSAPTMTYTVINTGTTLVGSPTVTDGTAVPAYQSGDTNGDGLIEPGESWIYTTTGSLAPGQHVSNAAVSGTPLDALGAPISGVSTPQANATSYYFQVAPSIDVVGGIYRGWNNGADCATAGTSVVALDRADLTYCFTIINTGNDTVTGAQVVDAGLGISVSDMRVLSGSLTSLAPGARTTLIYETRNTSEITSSTSVTMTPSLGADVSAAAALTRTFTLPMIALT